MRRETTVPEDRRALPDATAVLPVRPAAESDVPAVAELIAAHVRTGDVLPRTAENIRETLSDWFVVGEPGALSACGSLWFYSSRRAEVRSLVVSPAARGQGLGQKVVSALVTEARARGAECVFTLTRAVRFFELCGFEVTSKDGFPEKVWKDCQGCPLLDACDETAMIYGAQGGEA